MQAHAPQQESPPGHAPGFRHDAAFYRDKPAFLGSVLPFISAAIERDEPVLVAVIPERVEAIRSELAERAKREPG